MTTRNNPTTAVLLLIPLLFLFLITSCDSDNNMLIPDSEAQEPMPELGEEDALEGCPCFTVDDVETAGNNSNTVECGVAVFGMALLPDSSPASALTVDCLTDGTMCQCSNGDNTMDISQDEFKACMSNIITGLIRYNDQSLKQWV